MAKAVLATDYLANPGDHPPASVNVVFGDETFLKRLVLRELKSASLGQGEDDFAISSRDGDDTTMADVLEELGTVTMFGGGTRLVRVDQADRFVSGNREALEDYVENPFPTGRLVLELKSFPANTRLHKAVVKTGLVVNCSAVKESELPKWLVEHSARAHSVQLELAAARLLVEMVGAELGLIDQEIGRLALSVSEGGKITAKLVHAMVGNWRSRTAWDMLDFALAGNLPEALGQLDRLLLAGEQPVAILGQIAWSLRNFAAATRIIVGGDAQRQKVPLQSALEQAGFNRFRLRDKEKQLRHLGRERGLQLYRQLVETDLALKGNSGLPPRLILENLLIRLAAPAAALGQAK